MVRRQCLAGQGNHCCPDEIPISINSDHGTPSSRKPEDSNKEGAIGVPREVGTRGVGRPKQPPKRASGGQLPRRSMHGQKRPGRQGKRLLGRQIAINAYGMEGKPTTKWESGMAVVAMAERASGRLAKLAVVVGDPMPD